ncbi:hypothetical protein [Mycolicibacterium vanbaalenii]|uniref:hypothetical protein n=1 Tax=Mycolicibacterium vanbaalenii TaxID=110539 RepID=UPI0023BA71B7|nr:hypothetical protein [Mycolicibacterium vanbaalenii]
MAKDSDSNFGEPLFAAFPEWRALARREVNGCGEEMVVIDVSAPAAADVGEGLWITWGDGEITVGLGDYHRHFEGWLSDDSWLGETGALEFVQGIVDERLAVVTLFDDDKAVAYTTMDTGAPDRPVDSPHPYNRMRVRSWNGTFDAEP